MINIRLKERREAKLSELKTTDTFKIRESSFVFMKVDVVGLTVRPKAKVDPEHPTQTEEPDPIRVLIPARKTVVVCLSTGKAHFQNLDDKVQVVELEAIEIVREKEEQKESK